MAYPDLSGRKMPSVLPNLDSPLNIDAPRGDSGVPPNDMGDLPWASGAAPKDPMGFVTPIEGGKK